MNTLYQINEARELLKNGGVIAYPTEAVYGLGCSPFNQKAVEKILTLKARDKKKGLILLIADWAQLAPLIQPLSEGQMDAVRATWPGPVTWIFPKSDIIPDWVSGEHQGIAIRMSAHPVANQLCIDEPLVSTSANISGYSPVVYLNDLYTQFPSGLDGVVAGELGDSKQPSSIYDVQTGLQLR